MLANMLVTSICPAPSFATASTISHFLLEMYILVIILLLLPLFFGALLLPQFCHRAMNEVSKRAA